MNTTSVSTPLNRGDCNHIVTGTSRPEKRGIDSPVFAVHRLRERLELAAIAAGYLHPEQVATLQLQEAGL